MIKKRPKGFRILLSLMHVPLLLFWAVGPNEVTGKATQQVAADFKIEIKTPAGVSPLDVAIAADSALVIRPQVSITCESGKPTLIVNTGYDKSVVGKKAEIGTLTSVAPVTLGSLSHAAGSVKSGAHVLARPLAVADQGVEEHEELTPFESLVWNVSFPETAAEDVRIKQHKTRLLPPGQYHDIFVEENATLKLTSGVYYVATLKLRPEARLEFDPDRGSVIINILHAFTVGKKSSVVSIRGINDLLIVAPGERGITFDTGSSFTGTVVAPNAPLVIKRDTTFTGALFGKKVTVGRDATVSFKPALPLFTVAPPKDLQTCTWSIRPHNDLSGIEKEVALQRDTLRYCTALGIPWCEATLQARISVDRTAAAAQMVLGEINLGDYMAIVRDRSRLSREFAANEEMRIAACNNTSPDDDNDGISNSDDQCPGTHYPSVVDDSGCAIVAEPDPDDEIVREYLKKVAIVFNPTCANAPAPVQPTRGAFFWLNEPEKGPYMVVGRTVGQPEGCPVWYHFEVEALDGDRQVVDRYQAVFEESESVPFLLDSTNLGRVPIEFLQFNPQPSDPGGRGLIGSMPKKFKARWRIRVVAASGQMGPWSDWMVTTRRDCWALGFDCVDYWP
ncbi:MAG: hypothetical protein ACL93V_06880 [Candidatus Electrothrix sp. YB6]